MMDNRLRNGMTLFVRSSSNLLLILPVSLAASSEQDGSGSTLTVVLLVLLLIVLCLALVLAWKRLIRIEGGEGYHPQELWGRAQEMVQSVKGRWNREGEEGGSISEDNQDEEEESEPQEEEPDITAL